MAAANFVAITNGEGCALNGTAVARGAGTAGAAGAAAPAALVVRGRTGAEKCPFLQDSS